MPIVLVTQLRINISFSISPFNTIKAFCNVKTDKTASMRLIRRNRRKERLLFFLFFIFKLKSPLSWALAERKGFEPLMPVTAYRISRPAHSTTLTPFHVKSIIANCVPFVNKLWLFWKYFYLQLPFIL